MKVEFVVEQVEVPDALDDVGVPETDPVVAGEEQDAEGGISLGLCRVCGYSVVASFMRPGKVERRFSVDLASSGAGSA
ncbi:hypothetical protein [Streptomyces omiyaensis]|uniref:hypothetical protein n=1 Tax=Streptomyces omiyaensis TaxID=68247 RepID=UPI00370064DF